MIQFKGCEKALQNVEIHHKNYIKRLKKEHQKTIDERDGMYNRSTMEHEDVFMKAVKFHEENQENKSIIKTFKAHTGMYKEKYKKWKDQLDIYKLKYAKIVTNLEDLRKRNEILDSDVSRKNNKIIELTDKRLAIYIEKENLRDELSLAKGHEIIKGLSLKNVSEWDFIVLGM